MQRPNHKAWPHRPSGATASDAVFRTMVIRTKAIGPITNCASATNSKPPAMGNAPMRRCLGSLVLLSLFVSIYSGAAKSQPTAACMLFENSNYGGQSHAMAPNTSTAALGAMDDKASSVKVARDCILVGYDAADFSGPAQTFGPGDYPELPTGWNDRVSSARCSCRP